MRSGNPNAVITISDGFEYSFIPNDPQSNYTQGEHNELPPIPKSGEVTTALVQKCNGMALRIPRKKIHYLVAGGKLAQQIQ